MNTKPAAVFVFHQHGCPACAQYLPRFKRVASPFRAAYPIGIYDLAKDKHGQEFATRLGGIRAVPTTVVMTDRGALHKHVGALDEATIVRLLGGG